MTAPSPEAPPVPSALEPRPEGPSPRWGRAAQGLRWMRLSVYVSLAAYVVWVLSFLAPDGVALGGPKAFYLYCAVGLVSFVASAAGLWRYRSVPASTGAVRPARQAFACLACVLSVTSYSGRSVNPSGSAPARVPRWTTYPSTILIARAGVGSPPP